MVRKRTLVLGLGNEINSDDGVGVIAVQMLETQLPEEADFLTTSEHGVSILELFLGYERVLLVDAIQSGRNRPGTVVELNPDDFGPVLAPSPHFSGLPEMITIGRELDLEFPKEIKILAIEVEDPYSIGEELSESVKAGLPELVSRARSELLKWRTGESR